MALRIFTAQMAYKGPHSHDTTVKTGTSCFAPNWDIVNGHKKQKITDEQYTAQYLEILLASLMGQKQKWLAVLKQKEVVLTCFCGRGKFCHRYVLAKFLEKFGARYMGEINTNTGALIHAGKYVPTVLNEATLQMVDDFVIPDYMEEPKSDFSNMVVDPLTIQGAQAATCRNCADNRKAQAWTRKGTVQFGMVPRPGETMEVKLQDGEARLPNWEEDLGSKNFACCSHKVVDGKVEYDCPLFKELVWGYKVGLTSRGTNLDPCKNCIEHVDRGGKCFGDRCPDGTFPIKEGAGIMRG